MNPDRQAATWKGRKVFRKNKEAKMLEEKPKVLRKAC